MSMHHIRQRSRTTSEFSTSSSHLSLPLPTSPAALLTRPKQDEAFGAFTTTRSASETLRFIARGSQRSRISTRHSERRLPFWEKPDDDSAPPSPLSINTTIPSISRTASSFFEEHDGFSSPGSSALSFADEYTRPVETQQAPPQQLNHILARLERKSKICSRSVSCATCRRPGIDYPKCGKCGERWCSRECRLNGGKRHICSTFGNGPNL